jgi:hypothetical protein
MLCKCRWLAISVALWLTGLACARTTVHNIDASEGGMSGVFGGSTSSVTHDRALAPYGVPTLWI